MEQHYSNMSNVKTVGEGYYCKFQVNKIFEDKFAPHQHYGSAFICLIYTCILARTLLYRFCFVLLLMMKVTSYMKAFNNNIQQNVITSFWPLYTYIDITEMTIKLFSLCFTHFRSLLIECAIIMKTKTKLDQFSSPQGFVWFVFVIPSVIFLEVYFRLFNVYQFLLHSCSTFESEIHFLIVRLISINDLQ